MISGYACGVVLLATCALSGHHRSRCWCRRWSASCWSARCTKPVRRLLDRVLFSLGLVFANIGCAAHFCRRQQQPLHLPDFLKGKIHLPGLGVGVYRLFLVIVGLAVAFGLTVVGHQDRVRRPPRHGRPARGARHGQRQPRVQPDLRPGLGLAGLGNALRGDAGAGRVSGQIAWVYFLIVVSVGGSGNIRAVRRAILLGIGRHVVGRSTASADRRLHHLRRLVAWRSSAHGLFGPCHWKTAMTTSGFAARRNADAGPFGFQAGMETARIAATVFRGAGLHFAFRATTCCSSQIAIADCSRCRST